MKILHIFNELKFSGAEIMYVAAAEKFAKLGGELYAVSTSDKIGEYKFYFIKAGYTLYHWPYQKLSIRKKWDYYAKVIRFIKDHDIDVLHVHRPDMKLGMAYCAWRCGIKSVYTLHNVFPTRWFSYPYHVWLRWCCQKVFHQIHHSISDSVYEREKYFFHNKTVKIYNWYNNKNFYPASSAEKEFVRNQLNIPHDAFVVISVGGCSKIKRHEDVILAVSEVKKIIPNILYLHLGEGNTTIEEKKLSIELGIEDNVLFEGNKEDVRKYLVISDIYVMTSVFEGISLTSIEAMACGIPAILYNVPGLRDFNKEKMCSLLIDESPQILAESIITLKNDEALKKEIVANAQEFVLENYDMATNARKIFELYQ